MTGSQRIALNALATFIRSVFGMAFGLFSSRWVLRSLGSIDYGLMGVVGALITLVAFLNSITAVAVMRFLSLSIGKGDEDETNRWFNTALSLHTVVPVALVAVGWPIGEWAILRFLNIPTERLATSLWVFRFSILLALWGMCSTPYLGMYTAKQRIAEISLWGFASTMCNFVLAWCLTRYRGDAWLLYSGGTVALSLAIGILQVLRARALFPECRVRLAYWWDSRRIRQVVAFTGWNLFGGLGWMVRSQGVAILLNKFFSPAVFPHVNAAYGVANQVSVHTQVMSRALMGAFTPEIVASEGRGDRGGVILHLLRASKYSTYLTLFFAMPLWLEIDYVLVAWLQSPPLLSVEFCRMMILVFLISRLTAGYGAAISATGRIAGYQVSLGGLAVLTLPLIWALFLWGFGPIALCWVFIGMMVVCTVGEALWGSRLLGVPMVRWMREVVTPCSSSAAAVLAVGLIVQHLFSGPSFWRFAAVAFAVIGSIALMGVFVVVDRAERSRMAVCASQVVAHARQRLSCLRQ